MFPDLPDQVLLLLSDVVQRVSVSDPLQLLREHLGDGSSRRLSSGYAARRTNSASGVREIFRASVTGLVELLRILDHVRIRT